MFNLATLFVQIEANDKPVAAAIAGLQAKALASGALLSTAIGGAFATAFGAASAVVEGLAQVILHPIESIGALGAKAAQVASSIATSFGGAVTGALTVGVVAALDAAGNAIEKLTSVILRPVAAFGSLQSAALTAATSMASSVGAAFASLGSAAVSVSKTISSSLVNGFAAAVSPIGSAISSIGGAVKGIIPAITGAKSTVTSLAASFQGAWTAVAGPIGVAYNAITGFFGILDEGNEDVEQLQTYFSEAIAPIKEGLTGVVHAATQWIGSIKEMIQNSHIFKAAAEQAGLYVAAAFENMKVAIDSGVQVYHNLYAAAEEVFTGAKILLGQFSESLSKTFGGAAAGAQSWGETIQTYVIDKAELVGIAVRNWPDVFELAALMVQEKIINIGEYMATIPANAGIVATYIAGNWKELIVDGVTAVGKVFENLGSNIGNVAAAIYQFIQNPSGGFSFNWTPLLTGFQATAAKLPELLQPKLTDMSRQFETVANRIADREKAGFKAHEAPKKEPEKPEEAKKAEAAADQDKFKSQSFGVAEFASRIRQSIFSGEKSDVPAKQLAAAERTAKATEVIAAEAAKPKPARAA
jgi:hypothetical protein